MQQKGRVPWGYIVPALIILVVIIGLVYYETVYTAPTVNVLPPLRSPQQYTPTLGSNFACVTSTLAIHIHPWLQIWINGKNVTIPPGIGIIDPANIGTIYGYPEYGGTTNTCFEPMHTHDASGLIHIESSTNMNFTLGEFLIEWNLTYQYAAVNGVHEPVIFNQTEILGYKINSSSDAIALLVDGKTAPASDFNGSSSDYRNLILNGLDYCSSSLRANSYPCYPTDAESNGSIADPYWNGVTYPYGYGHTIVLEYTS
jgi:hypothetical protein